MRVRTPFLMALALGLSACAGPTPVERHWGEAKRNANEAMTASAQGQPGPGLHGREAQAAVERHERSLNELAVATGLKSLVEVTGEED